MTKYVTVWQSLEKELLLSIAKIWTKVLQYYSDRPTSEKNIPYV